MLDTETNKEEKLKEVYHQLEQLQNERKELQDEKTRLTEALALKEEDFVQLQLKVKFVVCASILGLNNHVEKVEPDHIFRFSSTKVPQSWTAAKRYALQWVRRPNLLKQKMVSWRNE